MEHQHKVHILAIAAHPDDVELGCAGTLIKHAQKGQKVAVLDMTEGELGSRGTVALRYEEAAKAAQIMALSARENAKFRDGFFVNDENHQKQLIYYIRKYQPDIVITNAPQDRHPDHGRACKLVHDACFLAGLRHIVSLEENAIPQNAWRPKRVFSMIQDMALEPDFYVDISDQMELKLEAIKAYGSQFYNPQSNEPLTYISTQNFTEEIKYRDALNGKKIGRKYAEGFISVHKIGIDSLDSLVYPSLS